MMTDNVQTALVVTNGLTRRIRDWRTTEQLNDNLFVQTDYYSGDTRQVEKSQCQCGKEIWIEYGVEGFRADRKRVFYPHQDEFHHVFRCDQCSSPVSESVPGAEYDQDTA